MLSMAALYRVNNTIIIPDLQYLTPYQMAKQLPKKPNKSNWEKNKVKYNTKAKNPNDIQQLQKILEKCMNQLMLEK